MDSLSGLFWDFGSLYRRRCGVVSDALSRQPSSSSTSLRRLRLGVAAQASGTLLSDISATPTLWRRVSHAEERCGVTDDSCCGSDNLNFLDCNVGFFTSSLVSPNEMLSKLSWSGLLPSRVAETGAVLPEEPQGC